jgi:hypothetical protein
MLATTVLNINKESTINILKKRTYAKIPLIWNISAFKYAKYAITNINIGSITRTWSVYLVTSPVKNPQMTPENKDYY